MNERRASALGRALFVVFRRERTLAGPEAVYAVWLTWGVVATSIGALLDFIFGMSEVGFRSLGAVLGLSLLVGTLLGLGLATLALLGGWLRGVSSCLPWAVLGALVWAALCRSLDVWPNLVGRHRELAVTALVASTALAVAVAAPGWALQARPPGRPSWLASRPGWVRWLATLALLGCALGFAWVDRTQFPDLYAGAHRALRFGSLVLLVHAGASTGIAFERPRARAAAILALGFAAFVSLPFWLLHSHELPATAAIGRRPLAYVELELARNLSDVDRDGYSGLLGGGDCASFDARVNPSQVEIPGNGIDDNCVLGDGQSALDLEEEIPLPSTPSPRNVVLITIDTMRPDRMSAYGYARDTTPEIARWAGGATRFSSAYTSGGWTTLAVPSLMRGYYPRRLWWNRLVETTKYRALRPPLEGQLKEGEAARAHFLLPIDDPRPTLAALLERRGMQTVAVVDSGFTQVFSPEWGFKSGFDQYHEVQKLAKRHKDDAGTATLAIQALNRRSRTQPFFMWVHFFGPHGPSGKHPGIPTFGDGEPDKYDHEIRFVDQQVGRLLTAIRSVGERPTAVVLTSDHGERFYNERSRGHGRDAAEDSIRVPLIIQAPGLAPGTVSELVSIVDIVPTILALTETPSPKRIDGVDLTAPIGERTLFLDTFVRSQDGSGFKTDLVVALRGDLKLVKDRVRGTLELNARDDLTHPARNLLPARTAPELSAALDAYLEATGGPPRVVEP